MNSNSNFSMAALAELLRTPEGMLLIRALKSADPATVQRAVSALQAGDAALATSLLSPWIQPQELATLLQTMQGGTRHG